MITSVGMWGLATRIRRSRTTTGSAARARRRGTEGTGRHRRRGRRAPMLTLDGDIRPPVRGRVHAAQFAAAVRGYCAAPARSSPRCLMPLPLRTCPAEQPLTLAVPRWPGQGRSAGRAPCGCACRGPRTRRRACGTGQRCPDRLIAGGHAHPVRYLIEGELAGVPPRRASPPLGPPR